MNDVWKNACGASECTSRDPNLDDMDVADAAAPESGVASPTLAVSPSSRNALEDHRQRVARLLEAGEPYRAIHSLLSATGMACFDRALVFTLASLARQLSLRFEAVDALELAFDEAAEAEKTLLCLLASKLLCEEQAFARAQDLLQRALVQQPKDGRLERRSFFVTLRSGNVEQSIDRLKQHIDEARKKGDRRTVARLTHWQGFLLEAHLSDHFRAAECHAKAAALCKALNSPDETFRAQRRALFCLSQIEPPPRQLSGAIKALRTTAKAAGRSAEAEEMLWLLELTDAPCQVDAAPPSSTLPVPASAADLQNPPAAELPEPSLPIIDPDEAPTRPIRSRSKKVKAIQEEASVRTGSLQKSPPSTNLANKTDLPPSLPEAQSANGRFFSFFLEAEQKKLGQGERSERHRLEQSIDEAPFDATGYRALAAYYLRHRYEPVSQLVADVADALEGRSKDRPTPPLTLNDEDWSRLQHPLLGAAAHELGTLIGSAVCEVCSEPLESFDPRGTFSMDGSDTAWALADALLCAVRMLGVRVGEIHLSREARMPIFPVCSAPPTLFVSKPLLKKNLPNAQLRFFAGRALAALRPELGMFLFVPMEEVISVLTGLHRALKRKGCMSEQTRALVQKISGKAAERLEWHLDRLDDGKFSVDLFRENATHTVNRLGLLTAGGIAPALKALEFERASESERAELMRFAISKVYFDLRLRRA